MSEAGRKSPDPNHGRYIPRRVLRCKVIRTIASIGAGWLAIIAVLGALTLWIGEDYRLSIAEKALIGFCVAVAISFLPTMTLVLQFPCPRCGWDVLAPKWKPWGLQYYRMLPPTRCPNCEFDLDEPWPPAAEPLRPD